jgi:hypothetical protein
MQFLCMKPSEVVGPLHLGVLGHMLNVVRYDIAIVHERQNSSVVDWKLYLG